MTPRAIVRRRVRGEMARAVIASLLAVPDGATTPEITESVRRFGIVGVYTQRYMAVYQTLRRLEVAGWVRRLRREVAPREDGHDVGVRWQLTESFSHERRA